MVAQAENPGEDRRRNTEVQDQIVYLLSSRSVTYTEKHYFKEEKSVIMIYVYNV